MDETSVPALTGLIHCQILEGHFAEAEQQLEFLNELHSSIGKQSSLTYLAALLDHHQLREKERIIALLDETAQLHFTQLKVCTFICTYVCVSLTRAACRTWGQGEGGK